MEKYFGGEFDFVEFGGWIWCGAGCICILLFLSIWVYWLDWSRELFVVLGLYRKELYIYICMHVSVVRGVRCMVGWTVLRLC